MLVDIHAKAGGNSRSDLRWAEGMDFSIPGQLISSGELGSFLDSEGNLDFSAVPARGLAAGMPLVEAVRLSAAFVKSPPLTARLPVSYLKVPPLVRSAIASILCRVRRLQKQRWSRFPRWPLDLSADFLADLLIGPAASQGDSRTPVLLTHDLDSPEGLQNLIKYFLPIEEAHGFKSANYVVPCGWPIDHGRLREIQARGHELGIHGYDHTSKTPFCEEREQRSRILSARELVEQYGMQGYRAPSLLRTRPMFSVLAQLYRYDSSIPTSGGMLPVPNNGCATARPFLLDGIVEIPLSLPRDGMLRFLGYSPKEIVGFWKNCADRIASSKGVVVLLTHCEKRFSGNPKMLAAYREFLGYVASDSRFVVTKPVDICKSIAG